MVLSRDDILKVVGTFEKKAVDVPGLGGSVYVRGMTAREAEVSADVATAKGEKGTSNARVLARCIIDENNNRLFGDSDIQQLAELPFKVIRPLVQAVNELSGLDDDDEAIEGNSEAGQSGSSPTE